MGLLGYSLFTIVHPLTQVKPDMDFDKLRSKTKSIITYQFDKIEDSDYLFHIEFNDFKGITKRLQNEYGISKTNELLKDSVTGYVWSVIWLNENGNIEIKAGSDQREDKTTVVLSDFSAHYDKDYNLFSLESELPDTMLHAVAYTPSHRKIAENFLFKYTEFKTIVYPDSISSQSDIKLSSDNTTLIYDAKKSDLYEIAPTHTFRYFTSNNEYEDTVYVNIEVSGDIVSSLSREYGFNYEGNTDQILFLEIFIAVGALILLIIVAGVGFKRYRAYEVGFRNPVIIGVSLGISVGITFLVQFPDLSFTSSILPTIFIVLFTIMGMVFFWGASEPFAREMWKEKFGSFDLLFQAHFGQSKIGYGILIGISGGLIAYTLWLTLVYISDTILPLSLINLHDYATFLKPNGSLFYAIFNSFSNSMFHTTLFFVFLISLFRSKIASNSVSYSLIVLCFGLFVIGGIHPWYFGIGIEMIAFLPLIIVFVKVDILATFFAFFAYYLLDELYSLIWLGGDFYGIHLIGIILIVALVILYAIYTVISKDKVLDPDAIKPAFARHITERQRLQGELEIAHDVQMSMLPRSNPDISGISIASKCKPAYEVGGDYYDFVRINDHQFGIVVGDVSGKGTKAAFYMTLTKGFLVALSRELSSPAEILTRMNKLFFENVDRGNFISMVFGIFDLKENTLTMARAGHNPTIVKRASEGDIKWYNPPGIALGLEKGIIFSKAIKEEVISISVGDVFVFYTDGFTEARNNREEEFGEEKLSAIIAEYSKESVDVLLDNIFKNVNKFMGRTPQHDDMTIVIVKIGE